MPTDYYIKSGLTTPEMAEFAERKRNEFGVASVELVDVVGIIEFKLPEASPGFRFIIRPDATIKFDALAEPHLNQLTVRESIYVGACEGDAHCRFVLAHELGHFLLHKDKGRPMHKTSEAYEVQFNDMNSLESSETQANMFASHFLVPIALAFELKDDHVELARRTRTSVPVAKSVISAAKRTSLRGVTQKRQKTFADKMRESGSALYLEEQRLF